MNGLPDLFAVLSLLSHALKTVYIHTHAIVMFFFFPLVRRTRKEAHARTIVQAVNVAKEQECKESSAATHVVPIRFPGISPTIWCKEQH